MAMAKVEVVCSECGKTYTVSKKCYNRREADNFEAWVAAQSDHLCHECYAEAMRKKREAERAEQLKAAQEQAEKDNLPVLQGSEKQIAWAEQIRGKLIAEIDTRKPKGNFREYLIAEISAHTEAHWWIDNRDSMSVYCDYNPIIKAAAAKKAAK